MVKIVLASGSPRRSELLKQIGLDFEIVLSDIDESNEENLKANELVQHLAYKKAYDVAKKVANRENGKERYLVVGADTVVVKDRIMGKPKDRDDAVRMLKHLSGSWHEVMTGIALIDTKDFRSVTSVEITKVKMKELTDDTILAYVDTKEPMDKAGAYGIQEKGAILVERIEGCYFNVVGLPLGRLSDLLKDFGVSVLKKI
ncbi:MAG TPA: septum formation inhibitor Maf [Hungateiclostridium thermocellum]|jgi:septum formation protein|uniref:dTTP/UTP pyrophosphatase n=2 Tax=Acetivibrio thermocellus TaxID=1515 RepID=NTPPA_ACET2|nr:Maf family protein [Acetivibrio thermocellus]A3DBJ9.1 RecName: Full=dTTP/UTP pyrophosphatase; Short=dTTPase/UTPase; AltName: Full=Nucleoside triphosphate pyrophosphatase; AltName: Full=Nucleotide pyrophosphatase; Short=Nucleotide PPase [Acetivibrio thermocellus ATCC 27405]CDG34770.1 Maf-like protein Cthe_0087 [Acetivibrio thermocellus BC1]ABN51328.1 maf protein [Acetivibrio thermocellus ATCC 27405]ADU75185.1 maf protein [Acetivibrio thermocellus DSM 1313]ALX09160.1 Septum formation protein 